MEVTVGAISPLLRKLGELLIDEYNLEKHVREGVKSLQKELTMMYGALLKVAEVPRGQLDPQVRIWAGMVRELSYDMEDAVDAFMVRVEDEEDRARAGDPTNLKNRVKKFLKKTTRLFKKGKDLHQIAGAIEESQDLAKQLAELRQRYGGLELHDSSAGATIDPRLTVLFKDAKELVGIDDTSDELIKMLSVSVQSKQQLKTVSIVGFGGLGKTTLARAVYDKIVVKRTPGMAVYDKIIEAHFHCGAFVSVGRDPDLKKVFKDLLYQLDKEKYKNIHNTTRDEKLLIDDLREVIKNKRYFIVIDDIWDEKLWKFIKCAFPEDNLGSRLITTTRNVSVSEACCPSHDDIIYKMKPLPGVNSRRLFYKRTFPHGNRCPRELEEVSEDILKKCGGVPLAIITIASLLANEQVRTKDQWQIVLNSIGRGLTEGGDVEDMQMILSFSYYDLPSHLKTCLLYLSIFPEDYKIGRDRLIWRWIAEGFVQPKKEGDNLFELGESYFNELINRSMIQPVYDRSAGSVEACIVHDMVLDLIYSLSREVSFVTISGEINTCSQSNVRWLSLQNSKVEHTAPHQATRSMPKVRSITLFSPAINLMPSLSCFKVLRVLDLEGCDLGQSCHLNFSHLGNLFHLRYLGLRKTRHCELPREIEKLQFLLTLDLRGANIKQLPSTVVRMQQLMCLLVDLDAMVPDGTGNLTSLEVLGTITIGKSPNFVEALRSLTRLRELQIQIDGTDEELKALMDSLSTLQEIQTLVIHAVSSSRELEGAAGWVPPPHLRRLEAYFRIPRVPAWVESLSHLSSLYFGISALPQEDLQILARLPALRFFYIYLVKNSIRLLVGAGFPCLRAFVLSNDTGDKNGQIRFQEGAMPRVERVQFAIGVRECKKLGLGYLLSLEKANIGLVCKKAMDDEVEEAEAALVRKLINSLMMIHAPEIDLSICMCTNYALQRDLVVHLAYPSYNGLRSVWYGSVVSFYSSNSSFTLGSTSMKSYSSLRRCLVIKLVLAPGTRRIFVKRLHYSCFVTCNLFFVLFNL